MQPKYTIRIETTRNGKGLVPWVSILRRGRLSVESQFFALVGYSERKLQGLSPGEIEDAKDTLELALRLLTAFEYIPERPEECEPFFEKKLLGLEQRLKESSSPIPLSITLGVVRDQKTYFATSGEILALQITGDNITNLAETNDDGPLHFETFREGALTPHSYLLFTPKSIGTLLKSEELKSLTLARGSERRLEYLEQLWVKRANVQDAFKGILLEARPKQIKMNQSTAVSIAHLLATESKTEELLSPSLLRPFIEKFKTTRDQVLAYVKKNTPRLNQEESLPRKKKATIPLPRAKTAVRELASVAAPIYEEQPSPAPLSQIETTTTTQARTFSLSSVLASGAEAGTSTVRRASRLLSSWFSFSGTYWKKLTTRLRALPRAAQQSLAASFNRLPFNSKILVIACLTLLFLFFQGILLTHSKNVTTALTSTVTAEIAAIQETVNNAQAALIYKDELQAKTLANTAEAQLKELSTVSKECTTLPWLSSCKKYVLLTSAPIKTSLQELGKSLAGIRESLRHALLIEHPTRVASLNQLLKDARGLVEQDGSLIVYGEGGGQDATITGTRLIQVRNGVLQTITPSEGISWTGAVPYPAAQTILLIDTAGSKAYLYNYFEKKLLSTSVLHDHPTAAALFNKHLYTLHPQENQIYKYDEHTGTYSAGIPWVQDKSTLAGANSLIIDGAAYLLNTDGGVTEYLKGKRVSFTLEPTDPPLTKGSSLWTDENSNYLYVLDPTGKRIVVFNKKNGTLKVQYVSPEFTDLRGMVINEQKKLAYILNGTDLLSIPLTHFGK